MFTWQGTKAFKLSAYSTQGLREGGNEDNYLLIQSHHHHAQARYLKNQQPHNVEVPQWQEHKIRIAVADGMGGHSHGREASETLIEYLIQAPAAETVAQLATVVKTTHKKLLEHFDGSGQMRPGSTLVVADIDIRTGLCVIANVGDSRIYLLRHGELHQLTYDHIYAEFAWRDGDVTEQQYLNTRASVSHHLTQAMGFGSHGILRDLSGVRPYEYNPNLRLDFKEDSQSWHNDWDKNKLQHRDVFLLQLKEDDVLLMASDGLWSFGADNHWSATIQPPLESYSLEQWVQQALAAGSQDNITLVMCARLGATGGYPFPKNTIANSWLNSIRQFFNTPTPNTDSTIEVSSSRSFFLLFMIGLWLIVVSRLAYLHYQPTLTASTPRGISEDQQLFEQLQHSTLLETDGQKRLLLKPIDYDLAQKALGQPLSIADSGLLTEIYNSAAGQVVKRQIEIWNQTREFSAIRDHNDSTTKWQITDLQGVKPSIGETVPEAFGFVHQKRLNSRYGYVSFRSEFGDWQVAQHSGEMYYKRTIAAGEIIHSQYIGRLLSCRWTNGQNTQDCQSHIMPLCKISTGLTDLTQCDLTTAPAGELRFSGSATPMILTLNLAAVTNPMDKVNGLAIAYRCRQDCQPPNKLAFTYQAEKTLTPIRQESKDSRFQIQTADGVALTDELGNINPTAEKLGLSGLIGVDKNDVDRLSYLMAKSHFPDNYRLQLMIDSRLQIAAQQALEKSNRGLADSYQPLRRAALVVLDADTGDIVASASLPQPPQGLDWSKKAWDKAVFASRYALLDPFLNRVWQGGDANQAPGSTFKVLIALAAAAKIQADPNSAENKKLARYLIGLTATEFSQFTRLNLSATELPIFSNEYLRRGVKQYSISNFQAVGGGYETMSDFYNKPLSNGCGNSVLIKNRLGVAEALRDSSNVWFAELAKLMDGKIAQQLDLSPKKPSHNPYLVSLMQQLGFADSHSLIAGIEQLTAVQQALWSRSLILKTPLKNKYNTAPLLISDQDVMMNLTQTAIGQSLYVTPLEMAQVAVLAATDRWLSPTLIRQWQLLPKNEGKTWSFDPKVKNLIRTGLAAVVQVGTAHQAFAHHPDRCQVYGKTGTAQVGSAGKQLAPYNTGWFIGWREPKTAIDKKLAFACLLTHIPKSATGGSLCAPIVADFLTAIADKSVSTKPKTRRKKHSSK